MLKKIAYPLYISTLLLTFMLFNYIGDIIISIIKKTYDTTSYIYVIAFIVIFGGLIFLIGKVVKLASYTTVIITNLSMSIIIVLLYRFSFQLFGFVTKEHLFILMGY